MRNLFRTKLSKQKAVFTVNIYFDYEHKKEYGSLKPRKSYYIENNNEKFSYDDLKKISIEAIEKNFQREIEEICGLPVIDIRVNRTYRGSIELVFIVLFNAFQFIDGIKDFYDNLRLIRETSNKFLKNRIKDECEDFFEVNTTISYPNTDHYFNPEELLKRIKGRFIMPPFIPNGQNCRRDGLFYYLHFFKYNINSHCCFYDL